jgi:hypothetical protein
MDPVPQMGLVQPVQAPPPPQPRPASKNSGLAITAFVFSLLLFVPILPLIGAILGIVSLANGIFPNRVLRHGLAVN